LVVLLTIASGCDPGHGVTFVNQTDRTIAVYENTDLDANLAPAQQRTFTFIVFEGSRTFLARDEAGNVIFQQQYTWADLKRLQWRIVIGKL